MMLWDGGNMSVHENPHVKKGKNRHKAYFFGSCQRTLEYIRIFTLH